MTKREAKSPVTKNVKPAPESSVVKFVKQSARVIIGLLLIVAVGFVLMNWSFFAKNVGFWWQKYVSESWGEKTMEVVGEPDRLRIASLNIETPLVYISEVGESHFQKALEDGVTHYPGTAMPGEKGNAFYFGHSSDFTYKPGEYKTVFALLPQIQTGAEIEITDQRGRLYRYQVFNTLVVSPTQTEVLSQGDRSESLLTLQTSYPVGTAFKRFIVQAKLIT